MINGTKYGFVLPAHLLTHKFENVSYRKLTKCDIFFVYGNKLARICFLLLFSFIPLCSAQVDLVEYFVCVFFCSFLGKFQCHNVASRLMHLSYLRIVSG